MRSMTKLFVAVIVVMSLMIAGPAMADEFGMGPAWIDGHSGSGDYGMNNEGSQSWGFGLHYDKDLKWVKKYSEKTKIGIDPGMFYLYARWTKNNNKERTKWHYKEYDECIECYQEPTRAWSTTEHYTKSETVNSHILGVYFKPYLEYGKLRLFGLGGPALEIADDADNFAITVGGGIQYRFTENFGASLTQYEVYADPFSEHRRFDATVFSIDYIW